MTTPRFPRRGLPHTFGWMRRPADKATGQPVWQTPAGIDYVLEPGRLVIQICRGAPVVPDKMRVPL